MAETNAFKKLQKDYLADTFGLQQAPNTQPIPEGTQGAYQVQNAIDHQNNWIYQQLLHNNQVIADNNPPRLAAHKELLSKNPCGWILISGLGLGPLLHALLQLKDVARIDIVEKQPEIIQLVEPAFKNAAKPIRIINADILEFKPKINYTEIYHALWHTRQAALADKALRQRLKNHLGGLAIRQSFAWISTRGGHRPAAGRPTGTHGPNKKAALKRTVKKGHRYTKLEFELIEQAAKLTGTRPAAIAQEGAVRHAARIVSGLPHDKKIDALIQRLETRNK